MQEKVRHATTVGDEENFYITVATENGKFDSFFVHLANHNPPIVLNGRAEVELFDALWRRSMEIMDTPPD